MKQLPPDDFRSSRYILEPDDFALGPETPDRPPSDLLDQKTWRSITSLPDDVAIRTSNHYGSTLHWLYSHAGEWTCLVGAIQGTTLTPEQSPIAHAASDAGDEFQSSIYNALVGYYRVAFSCLRNVLELMTLGLQLELSNEVAVFESWILGESQFGFGWAADLLRRHGAISSIENRLFASVNDDLFRQKTNGTSGGFARRLFVELSMFTHAAPGYTDSAMRRSNGPIFVSDVFENWASHFSATLCLAVAEAKLAKNELNRLAWGSSLSIAELYQRALNHVAGDADGSTVLRAIPSILW